MKILIDSPNDFLQKQEKGVYNQNLRVFSLAHNFVSNYSQNQSKW